MGNLVQSTSGEGFQTVHLSFHDWFYGRESTGMVGVWGTLPHSNMGVCHVGFKFLKALCVC